MGSPEINPSAIAKPRSKHETIAFFLRRGVATKDFIARLATTNTIIISPDGQEIVVGIKNVAEFIDSEVKSIDWYYSVDCRYKPHIEMVRRQTHRMAELFRNRTYAPLIKIMADEAVRQWNIADRMDVRAAEMTPEERISARRYFEENLKREREISRREYETGIKEEHGFPPELLRVGGEQNRWQSRLLLAYAAVLAKQIS